MCSMAIVSPPPTISAAPPKFFETLFYRTARALPEKIQQKAKDFIRYSGAHEDAALWLAKTFYLTLIGMIIVAIALVG